MNLLIVGQGAWASKIQSALSNLISGIHITSISARVALKDFSQLIEAAETSQVIWICTKPDWQMELLPKLSKFTGKLILEKPYIVDEYSMDKLTKFMKYYKGALQLSEPWTLSNIWSSAKKEIQQTSKIEIMVQRGGSTGHNFMSAVMDWLPHDLNLLFDLYGTELLKSKVSNIYWKKNRSELEFQISMGSECLFHFKVGKFEGNKVAIWESRALNINFLTSTLSRGSRVEYINQDVNPFILQIELNAAKSPSTTRDQLEVQNYFFYKLLK